MIKSPPPLFVSLKPLSQQMQDACFWRVSCVMRRDRDAEIEPTLHRACIRVSRQFGFCCSSPVCSTTGATPL